ncbi:cytochrome P450 [Pseudonocardia eucalypti]|uniref:Cytochrome P450 n=1 Tax=Pseudonocardia eucalypti TaxID=648755 RepID=A0ABP9PGI0_9PSEU|nr:cytochrome P450 [Pseudonocardia eucalypti]
MTSYDPYDPAVKEDPQKYFKPLRDGCPVHHHVIDDVEVGKMNENPWIAEPTTEFWSLSRYQDCVQVLQTPALYSSKEGPGPERTRALTEDGMLLFSDDPAHRWQRSIANKAFTPRRVALLEPDIQKVADDLIDQLYPRGECDLHLEFAAAMTIRVVAKVVGVDDSRIDDFFRWGNDTIGAFGADEEGIKRSFTSGMEFLAYFNELLEDRRTKLANDEEVPDDILTAMITAADEETGKKLSDVELFMGAQQFMVAGFETTTTTIGSGIWLLNQHPEQLQKVKDNPDLILVLVEEVLRYASPLEGLCRTATEDTEIAGVKIPKGGKVRWLMASANRDERAFERADEFDLDRDRVQVRKHLSFGHGIHMCLGSALARMELKIAFETLLRRLPNLRPDPDKQPERNKALLVSGFSYLPVVWDVT